MFTFFEKKKTMGFCRFQYVFASKFPRFITKYLLIAIILFIIPAVRLVYRSKSNNNNNYESD